MTTSLAPVRDRQTPEVRAEARHPVWNRFWFFDGASRLGLDGGTHRFGVPRRLHLTYLGEPLAQERRLRLGTGRSLPGLGQVLSSLMEVPQLHQHLVPGSDRNEHRARWGRSVFLDPGRIEFLLSRLWFGDRVTDLVRPGPDRCQRHDPACPVGGLLKGGGYPALPGPVAHGREREAGGLTCLTECHPVAPPGSGSRYCLWRRRARRGAERLGLPEEGGVPIGHHLMIRTPDGSEPGEGGFFRMGRVWRPYPTR